MPPAPSPPASIRDLLRSREVVIAVGPGGVGKTSVAAALGVAAAREGRSVLVLTVDPALRLAEALGVSRDTDARQTIVGEQAKRLGVPEGRLSVMMLDPARTWNELIERTTQDPAQRRRVLEHPLYRLLLRYLAGAQEYMAMEKLLSVLEQQGQDLVVLDTPPSRHALDFLRAPARLIDAVDGPLVKALARGPGVRWLSRTVALSVRAIGRIMGATMLEDLAQLIALLDRALGGLRQRAERVSRALSSGDFAYVLVSRPLVSAVSEALRFESELARNGLSADAVVLNASAEVEPRGPGADEAAFADWARASVEPALLDKIRSALLEHDRLVRAEAEAAQPLVEHCARSRRVLVRLPAFAGGSLSVEDLSSMAERLHDTATRSQEDPSVQTADAGLE